MAMIDPVCGMEVSEHETGKCLEYEGQHYCFCSDACMEEFRENPEMYASDEVVIEEEEV